MTLKVTDISKYKFNLWNTKYLFLLYSYDSVQKAANGMGEGIMQLPCIVERGFLYYKNQLRETLPYI